VLQRGSEVVASAFTDATGRFGFDQQPAGSYTAKLIGLELTGLRPGHTALEPESQTVLVGGDPVELVFAVVGLLPPRVSGTITCAGSPVEGARVRIVGGEADTTVTTNAQGRYGANDLGTGYHSVFIASAPCITVPSFEVVDLKPGQGVEVNFGG